MRIIGAGFGRSGTMSLQKALEILGFKPCYHMQVALHRPRHLKFWIRAKAGAPVDYRKFFRKYKATVDWPACEFYKELMQVYPDAKVILNVRDPEKWYDSMVETIWNVQPILRRSFPRAYFKVHEDIMWNSRFQGEFENREKAIAIYKAHIEEVKRTVPTDKLLVYNVKEGWKPLCDFLGINGIPDVPFPNINSRKAFRQFFGMIRILEWAVPVLLILALVLLCVFVFRCSRVLVFT